MKSDSEDVFRYDPNDPESRRKLDRLVGEFDAPLPEVLGDYFGQLLEHLLWRKTASAPESDGCPALHVFLDLGEGDEVLLATIWAGKLRAFGHAGLYARTL